MPPKGKRDLKEEVPVAEEPKEFERTEQEEQCEKIFTELDKLFKKLAKLSKPDKIHEQIKTITAKLREAKLLIKDFEREARADGMPPAEVLQRKKALAAELNGFIAMKKEFAQSEGNKADLLNGAQPEIEMGMEGMSMQQLVAKGRKDINEIDKTLERAERIAEDTKAVGKEVAATLGDQTQKLNKIVDDLNEIEFTMKTASKVIRDITRGLLTDKCIAFLLLLVVCGVVAIIVIKIINPNRKKVLEGAQAALNDTLNAINNTDIGGTIISGAKNITDTATGAVRDGVTGGSGRRMLLHQLLQHALELNARLEANMH